MLNSKGLPVNCQGGLPGGDLGGSAGDGSVIFEELKGLGVTWVVEPHGISAPGLVWKHISARRVQGVRGVARSEVVVLKEDILVLRSLTGRAQVGGGVRGKITGLSRAARRRLLLQARNVDGIVAEATLTWPGEFPTDGVLVKRNLRAMLQWLTRRGLGGMWFLEFQKRGAPHFWLFLTGTVPKAELSAAWYRIVASGDERHLRAGTRIGFIRKPYALAAYAAKYAAKWEQKEVPAGYRDVGRFWGRFGGLKAIGEVIARGVVGVVAPVVRVVRGLYLAERRYRWAWKNCRFKKFRDKGRFSFVAWGVAQAVKKRGIRMISAGGVIDDLLYRY